MVDNCRDVDLLTALVGRGYALIASQGGSLFRAYLCQSPGVPLLEIWALLGRDGELLAFETRFGTWRKVLFTRDYVEAQLVAQDWRNSFMGGMAA